MTLNLVSPGVKVREVDLTVGRIDGINDQVGGIAAFLKEPVNEPVLIETESDLLETFGAPKSTDAQYEYWMTASAYLSYGGILRVLRTNNDTLSNANVPVGVAITDLSIKSSEDYYNNRATDTSWHYAARNPTICANGLKICTIDGKQIRDLQSVLTDLQLDTQSLLDSQQVLQTQTELLEFRQVISKELLLESMLDQ